MKQKINSSKLILGPNIKAVMHFIIVVVIIGFLATIFHVNPIGISIVIGLFFLTIALNRTTTISQQNNILTITKKYLLVIPSFKKQIDLDSVVDFKIDDLGLTAPTIDIFTFNYGEATLNLASGYMFYEPRYFIHCELNNKTSIELKVNTQRMDMKKLSKRLESILKSKYEFRNIATDRVTDIKK